ncbi:hypothetical protein GA0115257_108853 [Streptomyces sp. LcepLS]|nr:hypothetical protein GA0115257_108853 [Streptomyces sp. LcepLS]
MSVTSPEARARQGRPPAMPGPLRDVAPPRGVTPVPRCHACAAPPCSLPRRHARKRQPAPDVGAYPWKTAVLSVVRDAAPSHREATPVPQCRASCRDAAPRTPARPMRGAPRWQAAPVPRRGPLGAYVRESDQPPADTRVSRPRTRAAPTPSALPHDPPTAPSLPPSGHQMPPRAPSPPSPSGRGAPGPSRRGAPVPPAEAPPFPRPRLALALDAYGGRGGRTAPRTKRPPPLRQNPPPSAPAQERSAPYRCSGRHRPRFRALDRPATPPQKPLIGTKVSG